MKQVYIAAPFFNPEQVEIVESIKAILDDLQIKYFSPKDESMFKQGDDPITILRLNCNAIDESSLVLVVTDGKDVGTIWEAGYSYANYRPIIYIWLHHQPEQKFNLMLAASGEVVYTFNQLRAQLTNIKRHDEFLPTTDPLMLIE